MKKIIIGILLMIVLCVGFVMACNSHNDCEGTDYWCVQGECFDCIETDGTDYYEKGTVVQGLRGDVAGWSYLYDDDEYCSGDRVLEYVCNADSSFAYSHWKDCIELGDYSCYDGACVYNGVAGEVDAGVALVGFGGNSLSYSDFYDSIDYELNKDVLSFAYCTDSDEGEDNPFAVAGYVSCSSRGVKNRVFGDYCFTTEDFNGNGYHQIMDYCIPESENDPDCSFINQVRNGKQVIDLYGSSEECMDDNYNSACEYDANGFAYCTYGFAGQLEGGDISGGSPDGKGWFKSLRNRFTGGFFF
jgi:hypothetical protein